MNQLEEAVKLLNMGDVVAFPTETVFGLGARIDRELALKKIFAIKRRPFFDPLIVHVSSVDSAKTCFKNWNLLAQTLAEKFWPGPLTLVMEKSEQISELITSGLPAVGVRIPDHSLALELLNQVGTPLAAPSANLFGRTSPTKAEHVRHEFGQDVFVMDGPPCKIGIESTVLFIRPNNDISILRKGAVLQSTIGQELSNNKVDFRWVESVHKNESPGHMKHHYMPEIPFIICKNPMLKVKELVQIVSQKLTALPDEIEGVKITKPTQAIGKIEFLKLSRDPVQAAREVYSQLRTASQRKPDLLCLTLVGDHSTEEWGPVMDRLHKAASLVIE